MVALRHPVQISVNPIAITVVDEYRVNIAVSRKLKRLSFVSNTTVENRLRYGGPFVKTYNFQNSRGCTCSDVIIFCVES